MSTLPENVHSFLSDCKLNDWQEIIKMGKQRIKPDRFLWEVQNSNVIDLPFNPFSRGLIKASEMVAKECVEKLWFALYPASVILLIGETGAGKSSLLYNIGIHAARNEPLWNIPFGKNKPMKVFYLDPENAGNWEEGNHGNAAQKLAKIGAGQPENLIYHDGRDIDLSNIKHMDALTEYVKQEGYDIVILDPIANLFNTKDENDNAEAAAQMKSITTLSRETGACVIICHHTGKDAAGHYGRGASARLAAADVGITFRVKGNYEDVDDDYTGNTIPRTDVCRLQIVKNRHEGKGSLFLQMMGDDKFSRVKFEEWKAASTIMPTRDTSKDERAAFEIKELLFDGQWHSRKDIQERMQIAYIGRNATDEALKQLITLNVIEIRYLERGAKEYRLKAVDSQKEEEIPVSQFPFSLSRSGNWETGIEPKPLRSSPPADGVVDWYFGTEIKDKFWRWCLAKFEETGDKATLEEWRSNVMQSSDEVISGYIKEYAI